LTSANPSIRDETEIFQKTLGAFISEVGGAYSFFAAIITLIFGASKFSPCKEYFNCHKVYRPIRRQLKKDYAERYNTKYGIPLIDNLYDEYKELKDKEIKDEKIKYEKINGVKINEQDSEQINDEPEQDSEQIKDKTDSEQIKILTQRLAALEDLSKLLIQRLAALEDLLKEHYLDTSILESIKAVRERIDEDED
ncbi:36730_t:CDS:2, partial [Racocetra persica]